MKPRIGLAAAALLLAGCAATRSEPPPLPFTGTTWNLVLEAPPPGPAPWVRFADGRVQGFLGCNDFAGNYLSDTVGARSIAIGRVEKSQRLCEASVVALERRLLEVLQAVSSYSITVDTMVMVGSGGALKFQAVGGAAKPK